MAQFTGTQDGDSEAVVQLNPEYTGNRSYTYQVTKAQPTNPGTQANWCQGTQESGHEGEAVRESYPPKALEVLVMTENASHRSLSRLSMMSKICGEEVVYKEVSKAAKKSRISIKPLMVSRLVSQLCQVVKRCHNPASVVVASSLNND